MIIGFQAKSVNLDDESTVLIDTEKYLKIFKNSNKTNDCSENEVYQECGSKCILSCRFASSALGITLSKEECNKNECVKACFCKDGFVRHADNCVAVSECSSRKGKSNKVHEAQPEQQFQLFGQPFIQPYGQQQQFQPFPPFQPFGLIKHIFRPGCGLGGCPPAPVAPPPNIHIHNHNEAINGEYLLKSNFISFKRLKMY